MNAGKGGTDENATDGLHPGRGLARVAAVAATTTTRHGWTADVTTATEASAAPPGPRPRCGDRGNHGRDDGRHGGGDDRHRRREATDTADEGPAATTGEPVAADDSLEPVTFGFHNEEGPALSLPEIRHGFEEGIGYVNEELGGINGHPIEIESCNVALTPESSVNCANQFVEAGVEVAVQGVDYGGDAALPVLSQAGIAEIALAAFTPGVNSSQGDAFVTLASTQEFLGADMKAMSELGTTHVAVILLDTAAGHAYETDVLAPIIEELGMECSFLYFTATTDWTLFSAVIVGSGADGISFPAPEEGNTLAARPGAAGRRLRRADPRRVDRPVPRSAGRGAAREHLQPQGVLLHDVHGGPRAGAAGHRHLAALHGE